MSSHPDEQDSLKTRVTLLAKVREGDERGWTEFYGLYEKFIYSAGRGAGLSREESRDVVQEVMISVRNYIAQFVPDKSRGRFRTWLRRIVQCRIADQYRKKIRDPLEKADTESPTDEFVTSITNRIPDMTAVELDRLIDRKLEQAILREARRITKDKVRTEDYQAYDLFSVKEASARAVADSLAISAVTVRVRAFRVRRAVAREIRRIVRRLDEVDYARGCASS
jgi:RNA polymerase sigma-70 factor, ECF subfamily